MTRRNEDSNDEANCNGDTEEDEGITAMNTTIDSMTLNSDMNHDITDTTY
jgi:hypothetical protein